MSARDERVAVQGPQGPQGDRGNQGNRGEKGPAGLSVPVRRALVYMFVFNLLIGFGGILFTAHAVNANNGATCASIEADARIPVPQPVAHNPSREWEAQFEAIERQRERQLGCK